MILLPTKMDDSAFNESRVFLFVDVARVLTYAGEYMYGGGVLFSLDCEINIFLSI